MTIPSLFSTFKQNVKTLAYATLINKHALLSYLSIDAIDGISTYSIFSHCPAFHAFYTSFVDQIYVHH